LSDSAVVAWRLAIAVKSGWPLVAPAVAASIEWQSLHQAAARRDTFATIGTMGLSLLVALIGTPISELAPVIAEYQAAWQAAGHPGQGEVRLRLPIYVADTQDKAQAEPYPSVMPYYERLRQGYLRSAQGLESAERTARAAQLASLTYAEVLQERVVFGTPECVAQRLRALQQALGLAGIIVEPNVGGGMPSELIARSMGLPYTDDYKAWKRAGMIGPDGIAKVGIEFYERAIVPELKKRPNLR